MLVASYLAAAVANAQQAILGLPPSVLGLVGTLVFVAAWIAVGWATGRARSVSFVRWAPIVWALLLAILGLGFWAIGASQATSQLPGDLVTVVLMMAAATPFHGLAGFLPVSIPAKYLLVAAGTALTTAAANGAARRLS